MPKATPGLKFIFLTILLDALGIGVIIPVLPDVIRRFSSDPRFVNDYFGYFSAVYAFVQFLASPVLGTLADRFGRRPVLLVSLLGAGLDYVLMAFAPNLSILFLGRVLSGLTGASMTVANSYMADISTDATRSANFGMIGAAWGLGFIFGPMVGGLLGDQGPAAPFLAAAAFNLANFLFGLLVLPESLPKAQRRAIDLRRINPARSLLQVLKPSPTLPLILVLFLLILAGQAHPSIWALYTQYKFHWTPSDIGLSLTFVGLTTALVQGYLTRLLIPRLGEATALTCGVAVQALCFGLYAIADASWMMYAVTAAFAFSGLAAPALQSLIAKQTPSDQQGELQGSLMSLLSLNSMIAPLLYTQLFSIYTAGDPAVAFPGIAYLAAAAISALALLGWVVSSKTHKY